MGESTPVCQCCEKEGRDVLLACGAHSPITPAKLYKRKFSKKGVVRIDLCRLCHIELFRLGETSFLRNHPEFAKSLG